MVESNMEDIEKIPKNKVDAYRVGDVVVTKSNVKLSKTRGGKKKVVIGANTELIILHKNSRDNVRLNFNFSGRLVAGWTNVEQLNNEFKKRSE